MRVLVFALLVSWSCQAASPAQPRLLGWIDADGQIVLEPVGGTVSTGGLDLTSDSGSLVPIPPGDLSPPADPFDFLLSNQPRQVTLGTLGRAVPISEPLRLGVGFNLAAADPCADVQIGTTASRLSNRFCTIPGDVDFDGHVGFGDFLVFAENFASTEANWTMGDFDWDKKVGLSDFVVLRGNFGRSIPEPSVAVPEPSPHTLLLVALAGLVTFRARLRSSC